MVVSGYLGHLSADAINEDWAYGRRMVLEVHVEDVNSKVFDGPGGRSNVPVSVTGDQFSAMGSLRLRQYCGLAIRSSSHGNRMTAGVADVETSIVRVDRVPIPGEGVTSEEADVSKTPGDVPET